MQFSVRQYRVLAHFGLFLAVPLCIALGLSMIAGTPVAITAFAAALVAAPIAMLRTSRLIAQEVHDAYLALATCSFVLSQQFKAPAVSPEDFGRLLEERVREQLRAHAFVFISLRFSCPQLTAADA
jgi:hypothetical protein